MVRTCSPHDRGDVRQLLDQAFHPSRYESRLFDIVSRTPPRHLHWLVERDSRVVAYILYTPASKGSARIGYHLAPVAVHPDFQRRGIGRSLIRETLASDMLSHESIFVLGDPAYYEEFGFVGTATARCPFDDQNGHFRSLRWQDTGDAFEIGYVPAFDQAGQDAPAGA